MINLIPNEDKKKMSKDFYIRLTVIFFVMLSISFLIASVLILPSYFLSSTEKKLINTKLEIQKNEQNILLDQNTIIAIKDLENKLSLIKNTRKNDFIFSQRVIDEIVLKKTPKIKITRIYYKNNSQTDNKINISGKAPGRESILFFRRILEDDTAFSKVDLPILKFVKGIYIKFNLNLIPRLNN